MNTNWKSPGPLWRKTTQIGPHRHLFTTNAARTQRVCTRCGAVQIKVSGRWVSQ